MLDLSFDALCRGVTHVQILQDVQRAQYIILLNDGTDHRIQVLERRGYHRFGRRLRLAPLFLTWRGVKPFLIARMWLIDDPFTHECIPPDKTARREETYSRISKATGLSTEATMTSSLVRGSGGKGTKSLSRSIGQFRALSASPARPKLALRRCLVDEVVIRRETAANDLRIGSFCALGVAPPNLIPFPERHAGPIRVGPGHLQMATLR